jgi:hypothetical protein
LIPGPDFSQKLYKAGYFLASFPSPHQPTIPKKSPLVLPQVPGKLYKKVEILPNKKNYTSFRALVGCNPGLWGKGVAWKFGFCSGKNQ